MSYDKRRRHILKILREEVQTTLTEEGRRNALDSFGLDLPPEDMVAPLLQLAGWLDLKTPLQYNYLWDVLRGQTRDKNTLDKAESELKQRGYWTEPPTVWDRISFLFG